MSVFECFLSVFEYFESILMWKRRNLNTFYKNITNSRDSDELFQLLAHFVSIMLKKIIQRGRQNLSFYATMQLAFIFDVALAIFDRYG